MDINEREITRNELGIPKLFHVRVVRVGAVHLIVGILTVGIGIVDVCFSSLAFDVFPTAKVASGIWVGCVILLTGTAGVVTSRSEVRRRAMGTVFLVLSLLSLILSIVMIGIAIAGIAGTEFAEGQTVVMRKINNGTNCTILTGLQCLPTALFDQKLVADCLLVALGYAESLAAFYSILTLASIVLKERRSTGFPMQGRGTVPAPVMSVEDYFEERMTNNHSNDVSDNKSPNTDARSGFTMHVSPSQGEFPDSDQFRAHLEAIDSAPTDNETNTQRSFAQNFQ